MIRDHFAEDSGPHKNRAVLRRNKRDSVVRTSVVQKKEYSDDQKGGKCCATQDQRLNKTDRHKENRIPKRGDNAGEHL